LRFGTTMAGVLASFAVETFVVYPLHEVHMRWYLLGDNRSRPSLLYRLSSFLPSLACKKLGSKLSERLFATCNRRFHPAWPQPDMAKLQAASMAVVADPSRHLPGFLNLVDECLENAYKQEIAPSTLVLRLGSALTAATLTYPLRVCSTLIIREAANLWHNNPNMGLWDVQKHVWGFVRDLYAKEGYKPFFAGVGCYLALTTVGVFVGYLGVYFFYHIGKRTLGWVRSRFMSNIGQGQQPSNSLPWKVYVAGVAPLINVASYPLLACSVRLRAGLPPFPGQSLLCHYTGFLWNLLAGRSYH